MLVDTKVIYNVTRFGQSFFCHNFDSSLEEVLYLELADSALHMLCVFTVSRTTFCTNKFIDCKL